MSRSSGGSIPGLSQAVTANRVGMGVSANPSLPPGVGFGSGVPHFAGGNSPSAQINGAAESTGAGMNSAIASIIKSMGASGGNGPGRSKGVSTGMKGVEKPTTGRSAAISRRLNGNPSRGTELKGL